MPFLHSPFEGGQGGCKLISQYPIALFFLLFLNPAIGELFHITIPCETKSFLTIQIDGTSHDDYDEVKVKDEKRQERLESLGVRFIRFHDHDVKRGISLVVNAIVSEIEELQK